MPLPIVVLNSSERWDCHQCGICCRGSLIPLSSEDFERLESQKWRERPEFRDTPITVRNYGSSAANRLAHRPDGSCVFLTEDNRCRIHAEFGIAAKPTVCQTFPLQLIAHEKHAVLTIRRACPSAAADKGRPTSEHLSFVKRLVRDGSLQSEAIAPPLLKIGEARDWKVVSAVLEAVHGLLIDPRYPPVRRLVHALQFATLLQAAKTKQLSDNQIAELAQTLAELAPLESKHLFEDRREPKSYSKVLFRLMAVECARLHPECRLQAKWSTRYELLKTAWKVLRGSGQTPVIDKIFPQTNLLRLEQPLGPLPPEIYAPLARWIETTSASYLYAVADRRDWSVVESIRGLALRFPVGLWLLRWLADGREPTAEDMHAIVVALDRSQGYAPHCAALRRAAPLAARHARCQRRTRAVGCLVRAVVAGELRRMCPATERRS